MTSAEFKTIRQKIGLSSQEMADYSDVALRTIQRIESGVTEPYGQPLEFLCNASAHFKVYTQMYKKSFDEKCNQSKDWVDLPLIRYKKNDYAQYFNEFKGYPESFHAALLGELYMYASQLGHNVNIVYFDPEAYFTFLGAKPDTIENRAAWALLESENIEKSKNSGHYEEFNK